MHLIGIYLNLKHHVVCHANQYFLFAFMAIVYGLLDIFIYYAIAVLHYATIVLHLPNFQGTSCCKGILK